MIRNKTNIKPNLFSSPGKYTCLAVNSSKPAHIWNTPQAHFRRVNKIGIYSCKIKLEITYVK